MMTLAEYVLQKLRQSDNFSSALALAYWQRRRHRQRPEKPMLVAHNLEVDLDLSKNNFAAADGKLLLFSLYLFLNYN